MMRYSIGRLLLLFLSLSSSNLYAQVEIKPATSSNTLSSSSPIITSGCLSWTASSQICAPSDGILEFLNAAGTSFTRLQLGGTTSSFPSLKRNAAQVDFRLADDSDYANINAKAIVASGGISAGNGQDLGSASRGGFNWTATGIASLRNGALNAGISFDVSSDGKFLIGPRTGGTLATELSITQTTPPTCTSANNCGTGNGTFQTGSSDSAGSVTLGTTPASGFVITFNGTWTAAPTCTVWMNKAGMVVGKSVLTSVTSTTTITVVTNGTAPATGDIYAYHCIGVQ